MYVFAGLAPVWKPIGMVYQYDPAADQWTKKKPMPQPSHHVAFTTYRDKIYAFGGFVSPESGPPAWVPINNAWEYDPAGDTWKALASMPTKRGSALAAVVNDKIYVIGGAATIPGSRKWRCPQRIRICRSERSRNMIPPLTHGKSEAPC